MTMVETSLTSVVEIALFASPSERTSCMGTITPFQLGRLINGKYYTEEQFQRATAAITLHCRLNHPSDYYLRFALSNGTSLNIPVTAQDVT